MTKRMLIDAAHAEETRVAVLHGNRIEEFDFEARAKKPLRGNIYLAKVTRVEPSLQAAFVDFGGNKHGFLAFNEIHPDYYQIPVADRQRLVAQEEAAEKHAAIEAASDERLPVGNAPENSSAPLEAAADGDAFSSEIPLKTDAALATGPVSLVDEFDTAPGFEASESESAVKADLAQDEAQPAPEEIATRAGSQADIDDALDEMPVRRSFPQHRPYKIHEVIRRKQILLVQVVKEERGTKGAALTTYLSLAGRYCVLMPNTARGGGISRKITNQSDRKRLKAATTELDVPDGMGLIVRTAGANRTKAEIKRDFEYLLRVWENVRELTLKSTAPALVYEEGSLIKRAIRDLYSKDIEAVLVDGDEGYKEAKTFMRTLMPSHAKAVQPYKDRIPLFHRFQIESQLDSMFSPHVHLRSGGYLVINQTEALVAVDVNSGRSTREHSIESTALRTNLEAAEEVARQLRLRDLAGLIVVDFIDMEEGRNNRSVEKRLKDSLKVDRARIQVGRISSFGLLEMSRQRLRTGVLEGSTVLCPHCRGRGIVRSVESAALHVLRGMEEEGLKDRTAAMTVRVPTEVALYLLNHKRKDILQIEERYASVCTIAGDDTLAASEFAIDRTEQREPIRRDGAEAARPEISYEPPAIASEPEDDQLDAAEPAEAEAETRDQPENDEGASRRRKRRRRRRGRRGDEPVHEAETRAQTQEPDANAAAVAETEPQTSDHPNGTADGERGRRKRRRGRRGGRRNRNGGREHSNATTPEIAAEPNPSGASVEKDEEPSWHGSTTGTVEPTNGPSFADRADQKGNGDGSDAGAVRHEPEPISPGDPEDLDASPQEDKPRRGGWWQRRFGGN